MQKINLLGEEIMKEGRDKVNDNNGKPFGKYQEVVERIKLIEWAKEEIGKRPEKIIVVKVADLAREMGPEFEKIKYMTLYSALRYILFYNDLKIGVGSHKDGDKVFIISEKRPEDKLPQSYLDLEKRTEKNRTEKNKIEKNRLIRRENKSLTRIKNIDDEIKLERDKIKREREEMRDAIRHERNTMLEKVEKERISIHKEKTEMQKEINELKKILKDNFGDSIFLVEVFQFNWKTLTWKLVKRKGAKTFDILFGLIKDYHSSMEDRYRFEFTSIRAGSTDAEKIEKEEEKGEDIVQKEKGEDIVQTKNSEVVEPVEEKESLGKIVEGIKPVEREISEEGSNLRCPRCGGANIATWPTVEIIRTRSGERKLRYRCKDCNETFGDEDLKKS